MEIGQKLKDKRTALDLSQEQLAEQLGVTRQTVANWEKGKTYPDISSVMKLSDLYGVSLDELLKEDADMKRHVEDSAALPRKYWNILFEVAILLLPFGLLVAHWGAGFVGVIMQWTGLLMLPPLWVARHRMFGMSKEDVMTSLKGWGLYAGSAVVRILFAGSMGFQLLSSLMAISGLMMIYGSGVYLERGTRFWLVIALYVGIPAYVIGSTFLGQLTDGGAFSKAQPFGHDYRIEQIEVGEAENPNAIVTLEIATSGGRLKIDGDVLGKFEYAEPANYQQDTVKGIWHLVPKEEPDAVYRLEVDMQDETRLSYLVDEQVQWRWVLKKIPKAWFAITNSQSTSASQMDWYTTGTYSGEGDRVNYTTLPENSTIHLECKFDGITELTVIEEYHNGGQTESREFTLTKDKNGIYPFPEAPAKRYEGDDQYILYRLQWDGGEYLFRLKLK